MPNLFSEQVRILSQVGLERGSLLASMAAVGRKQPNEARRHVTRASRVWTQHDGGLGLGALWAIGGGPRIQ